MNNLKILFALILSGVVFVSCNQESGPRLNFEPQGREVPNFNADSAYHFIEQQVEFGPRNPGSEGHQQTKKYLLEKLQSYAGERSVYAQEFTSAGYEGDTLELSNIIAAFNTQSTDRILLSAHWDTRPRAEKDPDNPEKPILGADDGGSGVGVLMELARTFQENPPPVGVDIVLFDGEDYGKEGDMGKYFLGSRHWAENPPVQGYSPKFGILLDMVGGQNAQFPKEGNSTMFALAVVNELWAIAEEKGYGNLFIDKEGNAISDDHVVVNRILGIPMIDVIRHTPSPDGAEFAPYWHTHEDDMDIISKETLNGVGHVLMELIYNRVESSQ